MLALKNKGFTLIELLVVITIIGVLATGAVSVYTSQIQKARDTTRINDMKALQWGIEQFYQDTAEYPQGGSDWLSNTSDTDVQDYVPSLAGDPKNDQTCNQSRCGYAYMVWEDTVGIDQWSYELSTAFENDGNRSNRAEDDVTVSNSDDNRWELTVWWTGFDTSKPNSSSAFPTTSLTTTDSSAKIRIQKNSITGF